PDTHVPGEPPSLEAVPRVADVSPATHVVVLTMQEDPVFAREALRAGAGGYVLKEGAGSALVEAGRRAAGGDPYLTPRLGPALATAPVDAHGPPDDLTDRE